MREPEQSGDGAPSPAGPFPPRTVVPLALVAATALALWWGARPAERWTVLESVDAERDGGDSLDAGDRFAFATLVTPGIGSATVQLGQSVRIEALPGAEVELPPGPGRWLGSERALRLARGRILVTTGDRPPEFDLVVITPQTVTRMAAATFSVEIGSLETRVCLGRGRIQVESRDGARVKSVPEGMGVRFFGTGEEPAMSPQTPDERARLEALDEAGLASADAATSDG